MTHDELTPAERQALRRHVDRLTEEFTASG